MKFIAYKCNVTEIILFNYISVETLIGVDNASGILRVLSLLFKHGNRENLVQYGNLVKIIIFSLILQTYCIKGVTWMILC